jgi:hypothetical protein
MQCRAKSPTPAWSEATQSHKSPGWVLVYPVIKWTKQVASHFGGTRQGLTISWPGHNGFHWELCNITEDYSEYNDLAAKQPEKLKELHAL